MKSAPKSTTTTATTEPWSEAKPYYTGSDGLYSLASDALGATQKTPYAGPLYAPENDLQKQALSMFTNAAGTAGTGSDQVRQLALDTIGGKYMSPDSNPFLKGAVDAATSGVQQNLTRTVLPQLQDQSIQQGAYGGSGYGVAQGLATSDFTKQALDIANQIYAANYAQERSNQLTVAPGLLGTATNLSLLPGQIMDMVGGKQQGYDQQGVDAAIQRYNMAQSAPWSGLGEFAQILNGGGFNTVGQVSSVSPPSRTASAIQGAAGAGGLASALFPNGIGGAGQGTTTSLAALLGALTGGA